MSYFFGKRSRSRLATVHPDLRQVMEAAIKVSPFDFTILEGVRTIERQRQLLRQGSTRTLRSRHLPHLADGLARAVDVAPFVGGEVSWAWPLYYRLALTIKETAVAQGIAIEWGGDWKTFRDGPHWQLPRQQYP